MVRLGIITAVVAVLAVGFALMVRLRPLDVAKLHLDPEIAARPAFPGHFLLRQDADLVPPVLAMPAQQLRAQLERIILATPRTRKLAGDPTTYASYVTRSVFWGFPDVASVKVVDLGAGRSTVLILSRLCYGRSDFGVNEARVRGWLAQLEALASPSR